MFCYFYFQFSQIIIPGNPVVITSKLKCSVLFLCINHILMRERQTDIEMIFSRKHLVVAIKKNQKSYFMTLIVS